MKRDGAMTTEPTQARGAHLGRMMASEPELTTPVIDEDGMEAIRRFADYVTVDGSDLRSMMTRMERMKFETIVTGKSCREVIAEWAAEQ